MSSTNNRITYGNTPIQKIIDIFGDEISYNELKKYENNSSVFLIVEFCTYIEIQQVKVYLNNNGVLDKKYPNHVYCNMFVHLNELEKSK
tara:strand:- start:378 stop:644 length:267 start_codon:yes stop_codon:yes gene_type:complete